MFDRVQIHAQNRRTEYVTREVHEHRAPTDESIKLLKEMEEKVLAKVLDSVTVQGNDFTCQVIASRDLMADKLLMYTVYTLNGKKRDVLSRLSWYDHKDYEKIGNQLREDLSRDMANAFLTEALKTFRFNW